MKQFLVVLGFFVTFSVAVPAQSPEPPIANTRLTVNTLVREDIFAGFLRNDLVRLARAEKNLELLLASRPVDRPALLAWQGSAALTRAALANEANQPEQFRQHYGRALISGSSHKCMHDLAPGRSASAVGRRCGCARARYAAVQSSVAQLTAACAGPALGGGPARRQPDQTQAADSMALTWRRTVKDSGTRPRLSPMFCAGAERSLTVQPPWNGQSVTIPVSGVAGLSVSPQLLSRYRRCSLVT